LKRESYVVLKRLRSGETTNCGSSNKGKNYGCGSKRKRRCTTRTFLSEKKTSLYSRRAIIRISNYQLVKAYDVCNVYKEQLYTHLSNLHEPDDTYTRCNGL